MANRHVFTLALILAVGGSLAVWNYASSQREVRHIHERYQQMRLALSSGDTSAASLLITPDLRGGNVAVVLDRLNTFAKPLGKKSALKRSSSRAMITPERIWHFRVIPGGHRIEMVKVENEWFFTGKIYID